MRKTQILMNKRVYLGLSILDLSKNGIYEFWYDYIKPKYGGNVKLYYMGTDSFIVHVKTYDIYKDIAKDFEKRCAISNFDIDRPLPKGKKIGSNDEEKMRSIDSIEIYAYGTSKDLIYKKEKIKHTNIIKQ